MGGGSVRGTGSGDGVWVYMCGNDLDTVKLAVQYVYVVCAYHSAL